MGLTNIHHAQQVLERAGSDMALQASIAYFNKAVLLVGRGFVQEEVDAFATCLHSPLRDRWVQDNGHGVPEAVMADGNIPIPTLYTSPGLDELRFRPQDTIPDIEAQQAQLNKLAYIIVVRGRSAALYYKVRTFYSRFAVAAGILEEALQGNCVAFSAALFKDDIPRLTNQDTSLIKVAKLPALLNATEEERRSGILLCC